MILPVTQRPRARTDLLEQFVYFGEEESTELSERYFTAVDETCALLVKQPRIGGPYDSDGIDVIRVIHGARDIENLFQAEER